MDTCTFESGLLRKKPCGQPSVTRCLNCEQPLCSKHAVAQMTAGRKTGKFMCKDCDAARIEYEKTTPAAAPAPAEKKAPAEKAAAPGAKPAPAAAKPAEKKEEKKEEKKPDDDAPLEFTPTKK